MLSLRLNWMSRKSIDVKFVFIVMFKPQFLKTLNISFCFCSISGPDKFFNIPSPSSQYKPAKSFLITLLSLFNIKQPTISQTSVPS